MYRVIKLICDNDIPPPHPSDHSRKNWKCTKKKNYFCPSVSDKVKWITVLATKMDFSKLISYKNRMDTIVCDKVVYCQ
jgi:hypothetical protein